jgi:DNA-binding LytR/AlgR family response regulator
MNISIVDPDHNARATVTRLLKRLDAAINVVQETNGLENVGQTTPETKPDLILVRHDILPRQLFSVEAGLNINTADRSLSYLAFRLSMMPQLRQRILLANNRLIHRAQRINNTLLTETNKRKHRSRFLVPYQQKLLCIQANAVAYFFSENRFIYFRTLDNRKFLIDHRMEELEAMLDPDCFFRINRSIIIHINAIVSLQPYPGNRLLLQLNPPTDFEVMVSRERTTPFKNWLNR